VLRRTIALMTALLLALSPALASAQPACRLAPVFEPFRDVIGVEIVGECAGEPTETSGGETTQLTTRGTLFHRQVDGVTMFANDTTTWLLGPEGFQSRPNGERLAWEAAAEAPISAQTAPSPIPSAGPSAGPSMQALEQRCSQIISSTPNRGGPSIDQQWGICVGLGEQYGAKGVDCYEQATRKTAPSIGKISTETHNALFDAELTVCKAAIR
jgi:hypothetical protein